MRWLGAFLLLFGGVFLVYGIVGAVLELGHFYQQVAADPLAQTEGQEGADLAGRMLMHAAVGAIGVVPLIAGTVILKVSIIQRLLRGPKGGPPRPGTGGDGPSGGAR